MWVRSQGGTCNLTVISSESCSLKGQLVLRVSVPLNISDEARLQTRESVTRAGGFLTGAERRFLLPLRGARSGTGR